MSVSEEKIINLLILKGRENFLNMMLTEDALVWFMVFNATFNNISVILWRSVLWVPGENHQPVTSQWQTLLHNVVSSTSRHERVRTHFSGDRHWLQLPYDHDHDSPLLTEDLIIWWQILLDIYWWNFIWIYFIIHLGQILYSLSLKIQWLMYNYSQWLLQSKNKMFK